MLDSSAYISKLKSISITASNSKRRLLLTSRALQDFQAFLEDRIGNEVFVVSTNIGMEVFYISELDYRSLIQESVFLYIKDQEHTNLNLIFKNNLDGIAVFENFSAAIQVFAKYPQVFLAYSKKFLFLLKQNKNHVQLTATLSLFYQIALENLKTIGSVPHLQRIEALYNTVELKTPSNLDGFLQDQLAKTLLAKVHSN